MGQVGYSIAHAGIPVFETMGIVSLLALAANGTCLALPSSVWDCSRNDIISNAAVFATAARYGSPNRSGGI